MSVFRLSALLGSLLAAVSAPAFAAGHYPVTIDNCGMTLRFDRAPSNVVTIGQSVTEALYALDLGDQMAGTSLWFNDVLPQFKAQNDKVPRLNNNAPSFEAVVKGRASDLYGVLS